MIAEKAGRFEFAGLCRIDDAQRRAGVNADFVHAGNGFKNFRPFLLGFHALAAGNDAEKLGSVFFGLIGLCNNLFGPFERIGRNIS